MLLILLEQMSDLLSGKTRCGSTLVSDHLPYLGILGGPLRKVRLQYKKNIKGKSNLRVFPIKNDISDEQAARPSLRIDITWTSENTPQENELRGIHFFQMAFYKIKRP